MLSRLLVFLVFLSFLSCETEVEEFLYNKYDSDYAKVIAAATAKCKTENDGLVAIKESANPENYTAGKIYKISYKGEGALSDEQFYVEILTVTSTQMTLQFEGDYTNSDLYGLDFSPKQITITKTVGEEIADIIAEGVCTSDDDGNKYFSSSNLSSSSSLTFGHTRTDGTTDTYDKRSGSYIVNTAYPILFYIWNSTIYQYEKAGASSSQETKFAYKDVSIEDYTSSCASDTDCTFINAVQSCNVSTNAGTYTSQDDQAEIINFDC